LSLRRRRRSRFDDTEMEVEPSSRRVNIPLITVKTGLDEYSRRKYNANGLNLDPEDDLISEIKKEKAEAKLYEVRRDKLLQKREFEKALGTVNTQNLATNNNAHSILCPSCNTPIPVNSNPHSKSMTEKAMDIATSEIIRKGLGSKGDDGGRGVQVVINPAEMSKSTVEAMLAGAQIFEKKGGSNQDTIVKLVEAMTKATTAPLEKELASIKTLLSNPGLSKHEVKDMIEQALDKKLMGTSNPEYLRILKEMKESDRKFLLALRALNFNQNKELLKMRWDMRKEYEKDKFLREIIGGDLLGSAMDGATEFFKDKAKYRGELAAAKERSVRQMVEAPFKCTRCGYETKVPVPSEVGKTFKFTCPQCGMEYDAHIQTGSGIEGAGKEEETKS